MNVRRFLHAIAIIGLAASATTGALRAQAAREQPGRLDPALYGELKFRHIGPEGNRVSAVTGVSGDPMVYYAGAASGGIFKTTDAGIHWQPIFDDQPVSSIGALAVAPSDPNVVWAGTGEPFIRSHISVGWGVFRSTDAGKTWTKTGLDDTGRISRLVVDPHNPDIALACALGHAYGPQPDRGVFRTTDGGTTWQKTLFVDEKTGCSDLVVDANNPRILFAGMWQIEIHTWGRESGGPGSGIYRSTDGGVTWKAVEGNGLPAKPYGKVGLALSKADANRVYALIEIGDGVPWNGKDTQNGRLWRSDDGGSHWKMVSADRQTAGRTHYYNRMAVTPDNPEEAYFLAASWSKTLDGGTTIIDPPNAEVPGGDHHDIWIDPSNGNRMVVGHDIGVSISANRGRSWLQVQLPIAQMYHVTVDNRIPYFVYGNRQDGPSARGPSNSKLGTFAGFDGITRGMWQSVGGGESGWATPDPEDPNIIWSSASGFGSVGGIVARYDVRTNVARYAEVWPQATIGWPAADLKYRFVWTFPLTISPHDHNRVYVGSQYVHVTTDGGVNWQIISPDLTLNDKSRQQISGGLTPDNIGVEYAGVVFAIAESRLEKGLIWVGTNDGLVHLTRDGGKAWSNLTKNLPGLPPWLTISSIEPSRYDAGSAYLTVDGHQANNRDPWIYKTTDFGKTWTLIIGGIARTPLSYVHCIKEDPVKRGLLYAGTENGLYVSLNDGGSWLPLQNNLPRAPVYGIALQEHFSDLVVATYGRGFWILDDITPLRQLAPEMSSRDGDLFPVRPTYRFRGVEAPFAAYYDPSAGQNPPYGAPINYWVRIKPDTTTDKKTTRDTTTDTKPKPGSTTDTRATPTATPQKPARSETPLVHSTANPDITSSTAAPAATAAAKATTMPEPAVSAAAAPAAKDKEEASISIADASGKIVRTLKGPMKPGLNRVWWDLAFDRTTEARLGTSPRYATYMKVGPEGMPAPGVGRFGLLAPPGTYTVKIKIGDRELSQPVVVRKDPESGGSEDEIRAQMELATDLVGDVNAVVEMINTAERVRAQLAAMQARLADNVDATAGATSAPQGSASAPAPATTTTAQAIGGTTPASGATDRERVRKAAEELDKKFLALEEHLFQTKVTGRGQDIVRWPMQLAEQLLYLTGQVTSGDFVPTTPQREVHKLLHDQTRTLRTQLDQLINTELVAFNTLLADRKLGGVVAGKE